MPQPIEVLGNWMTLTAAAQASGLSYWKCYRRVHRERLPTIRVGNALLVRGVEFLPQTAAVR